MSKKGIERRRWPRLKPSDIPFLKSVAINQGPEVQVIDISRGGMLMESEVRLQPQARVLFIITTTMGAFKISGHVLHSSITALTGTPRYRSAISFDHLLHMLFDEIKEEPAKQSQKARTESKESIAPNESSDQISPQTTSDIENNKNPVIPQASADKEFEALLHESLKLNDW